MTPTAPGGRSLSYKICPLFTYSIPYWEVCIHFSSGDGRKYFLVGRFCTGKFSLERDVLRGVNSSGEILYWEDLP